MTPRHDNLASRLTFALTNARDVAAARIHADGNFYLGDGGNMKRSLRSKIRCHLQSQPVQRELRASLR